MLRCETYRTGGIHEMSILNTVTKATPKPPMITLIGHKGTGKTSLAGLFPKAIIIRAEDGATVFESWDEEVQPALLPPLGKKPYSETIAIITELLTQEHDFKTLVIDSITALNLLFEKEICTKYDVTNVADAAGGFHKGYLEVANWHMDVIRGCDALRKKGIAIVFLGHSIISKIKNSPDESSEYAVWGLDMYAKSANVYLNNCDAVYYLTKEKFITGAETNKKGQTTKFGRVTESGERILITNSDGKTGYIDAKDRYSIGNEIPVPHGTNPLLDLIPFFNKGTN